LVVTCGSGSLCFSRLLLAWRHVAGLGCGASQRASKNRGVGAQHLSGVDCPYIGTSCRSSPATSPGLSTHLVMLGILKTISKGGGCTKLQAAKLWLVPQPAGAAAHPKAALRFLWPVSSRGAVGIPKSASLTQPSGCGLAHRSQQCWSVWSVGSASSNVGYHVVTQQGVVHIPQSLHNAIGII
jgi:hypothetical protein